MKNVFLKQTMIALALLTGTVQIGRAQIHYVENFDHPASTPVESIGYSVSSAVEPILIQEPGLSYEGYAGSGIGNASYLAAADQDASINFVSSSYNGGITYLAAMIQVTEANTSGDYFFSLGTSDTNVKRGRIFAKDDGSGNVLFGLSKGSTSTVTYTTGTYAKGTTYLLVLKYTFNAAEDDVDLYIFDATADVFPSVEPASPTISYSDAGTSDAANLKKVHLRQTSAVQSVIDGIRVTQEWEKAVMLSNDATLSGLQAGGVDVADFDPSTTTYVVELDPGTTEAPVVSASSTDATAEVVINQAPDVNGEASVVVTSEDGQVITTYTIDFNVLTLSSAKEILVFSIPGQISSVIDATGFTVHVVMPKGTDPSALVPSITVSDAATIDPASGVSRDFSGPVAYTVTAEDASTQAWTVTVEVFQEMTPFYESFDYPVGELLSSQGTWSTLNTAGNTEPLISEGNLSYAMLRPPLGNKATFDADGTDISMQFEAQNTVGTTVYFSFIFQVTDMSALTNTDGTHFAGLVVPTSTYGAGVYLKWDGVSGSNKFYIGTATRSTTSSFDNGLIDWTTGTYDINSPIFIVGGYEIVDGTFNDKSYLWVNPDGGSFGSETAPVADLSSTTTGGTSSDLSTVGRFYIRQDNAASTPFMQFDELRIAVSWAGVTPKAPEVSFVPENGSTGVSEDVNPKIYFVDPVTMPDGSAITNADIVSLVTLKEGGMNGSDVAFSGTISNDKMIMTVIPAADLNLSETYYIAVTDLKNEGGATVSGESALFTIRDPESVATLDTLKYNDIIVPEFSPEVTEYDIVLDYGTTELPTVSWTLTDTNAGVEVTNLTALPGTTILVVTAEDGTTSVTYTLNFSVSATMSSDATLKEIRINGKLMKGFEPGVYEYQYVLPFGTTEAPTISATTNSLVATLDYVQPSSPTSMGGVIVTAQDGTEAQYAIFFSVDPYIYSIGWMVQEIPEGWSTSNTIISSNFGSEPVVSHGDFEGEFAFRFICPKVASGSSSGWLATSAYPLSGTLRFWLYVQLPDGNESLTISKRVKGGDSLVIATLSANDMESADWKEFSFEINEMDSTELFFTSSLTTDGDTRIWIDDLSLRGIVTGKKEFSIEKGFALYPNPVKDILKVRSDDGQYDYLEIYSLSGEKIYRAVPESDITSIDLSEAPAGIYIVRLIGSGTSSSMKFIKL